jgi:hypothetical protein
MPTVIYTVKFSLTPGEDDDLIAFLEAAPARCRAVAVKAAMRGGNLGAGIDDDGNDAAMVAALDEFLF